MNKNYSLLLTGLGSTILVGFLLVDPFTTIAKPIEHVQTHYLKVAAERTTDSPVAPSLKEGEVQLTPVTLEFVGDIMMARNVEQYIKTYGQDYIFEKVGDLLSNNDLLIGNFESSVREKQNIEVTNVMLFDTTPDNVTMLANQGFDVLSLSNNHTDDFGSAVIDLTRQTIIDNGMTPFGDPWNSEDFVAHKTVNGINFAFIGFHAFNETTAGVLEAIKTEKAAGNFVIVMPHWGVEYEHDPSSSQIITAHAFVDAGADAVIGGHPHIVETFETYNGVPIVYSLGNFLFDQDWSEQTKRGMALRMTVEGDKLTLKFEPLYLEKRQMSPAVDPKKQEMLDMLGVPNGELILTSPEKD